MRHALARRRLSNRALMWLCVAALLLSLMPLPIVEMLKALGLTGESRTKRS